MMSVNIATGIYVLASNASFMIRAPIMIAERLRRNALLIKRGPIFVTSFYQGAQWEAEAVITGHRRPREPLRPSSRNKAPLLFPSGKSIFSNSHITKSTPPLTTHLVGQVLNYHFLRFVATIRKSRDFLHRGKKR